MLLASLFVATCFHVHQDNAAAIEPMVITEDTILDPNQTYGPLLIRASGITIDGRGAMVQGVAGDDASEFQGTGILAVGVSHVTLRNIRASGWETGLVIRDGQCWTVENCDFSGNFHDPGFGWGENGRRGGILLERVSHSVFRNNRASQVWDACTLVDCHHNRLEKNDFSHTSNTCLKLWHACKNVISQNRLSYGIRKDPGEVHARDSTCVLIESGSNDNRFEQNDCTHGGDGVFIRVLNGWVSTGNQFIENDCSYANNNCFEAWSPRNTYIRNKANHGSYGFWLGASDQTVLIGNQACENGLPDGNHNSPHLPDGGHAGIVFMFGPSSHTVVRDNRCEKNNGAGIALIGDLDSKGEKWKAFHWIIEQNRLIGNRWGVFMQHADWIQFAANEFRDNLTSDIEDAGNVTRVFRLEEDRGVNQPPRARLEGPSTACVGQPVRWDASASSDPADRTLRFRWDFGDGDTGEGAEVERVFQSPGFYRLGMTVDNGALSDLAWRDLYVTSPGKELGSEGAVDGWTWSDPLSQCRFEADRQVYLCGEQSLLAEVDPYSGGRVTLVCRLKKPLDLKRGDSVLAFWLQTRNPNVPAWQGTNPLITLVDVDGKSRKLQPNGDLLTSPPYNEAREGWTYFRVPTNGDARWQASGKTVNGLQEIHFGFDSWGAPPLQIRLDGISVH